MPIKNQPGTFMIFGHHKSGLSDYLNHFYSFDVMINLQNPDTLRKLIADKDLYFLKIQGDLIHRHLPKKKLPVQKEPDR